MAQARFGIILREGGMRKERRASRDLIKWESVQSQIDYICIKKRENRKLVDCTLLPGETCVKQHRSVVMDAKWKKDERIEDTKE